VPDSSGMQPKVLWSVLNRYVHKGTSGGGLTLLLLHANGLHKEVSVKTEAVLPNSRRLTMLDVRAHNSTFITICR
jgi:hypothetical protein